MAVRQISSDEYVLVAAPDAVPYAGSVTVAQLGMLPLIEMPEGFLHPGFIEEGLRAAGVGERNVMLELGHPEAAKRSVLDGLGYTLLLRSAVAAELTAGSLEEVSVEGLRLEVPIYLVHRREICLSPMQESLVDDITAALAAAAPELRPVG